MEKEILEKANSILNILLGLAKVAVGFGFVLVSLYCFSEQIFLTGMTLSDAFSFLYSAFTFATIFVVGIIYGTYSVIWFYRIFVWFLDSTAFRNANAEIKFHYIITGWIPITISFVCFVPFIALPFFSSTTSNSYWGFLFFFLAVGFCNLFVFFTTTRTSEAMPPKAKTAIIFALLMLSLIGYKPALLNYSFANIGIRSQPSDLILLSDKNYKYIKSIAATLGADFSACPIEGTETWITQKVNVVWHGFGEHTYIRLNIDKVNGPLFPIEKSGVNFLRDKPFDFTIDAAECKKIAGTAKGHL